MARLILKIDSIKNNHKTHIRTERLIIYSKIIVLNSKKRKILKNLCLIEKWVHLLQKPTELISKPRKSLITFPGTYFTGQ